MFDDFLQMMAFGKKVEYDGAEWILLHSLSGRTADGRSLYLAVRSGDQFPAQVHMIPVEAGVHLKKAEG